MFDALRLNNRRLGFTGQIDWIEAAFPALLALVIKIFLLQCGVDIDAHEFRAEAWIDRWS